MVRCAIPGTRAHHWHGHIAEDVAPVLFQVPGTVLVRWDEDDSGQAHRYPVAAIEPIPERRYSAIILGGAGLSDRAIAWAVQRSGWAIARLLLLEGIPSNFAAAQWATASGISVEMFLNLDGLIQELPPDAGVLALSDGSRHDGARAVAMAAKEAGLPICVADLRAAIAPPLVVNVKAMPPDLEADAVVYVGRSHQSLGYPPSALANPYRTQEHGRSEACDLFRTAVLYPALDAKAGSVYGELCRLRDRVLSGKPPVLACHCIPAECHASDIAAAITTLTRDYFYAEPKP